MTVEKILIVDDEPEISDILSRYLKREGFYVAKADNGALAIKLTHSLNPDLIILDILLPDISGIEICQNIRSSSTVPILFLSCKDDDSDKVLGLGIGGDDYITKPFSPSEVVARVKAHLRRNKFNSNQQKQLLNFPNLEIDIDSYTVRVTDRLLSLPAKEFEILTTLAQHPNQIFSAKQLFNIIWQEDNSDDLRTIAVHISNLRKKIEQSHSKHKYIQTVRGVGYKFTP